MILYRTTDSGRVTDLGFCGSDYVPKSDETMIEGDLLPDIDTLHEQKYLDALALVQYKEDRQAEYPSITEQLDEIYHNGINSWRAIIKVTKDKYPKDNT